MYIDLICGRSDAKFIESEFLIECGISYKNLFVI